MASGWLDHKLDMSCLQCVVIISLQFIFFFCYLKYLYTHRIKKSKIWLTFIQSNLLFFLFSGVCIDVYTLVRKLLCKFVCFNKSSCSGKKPRALLMWCLQKHVHYLYSAYRTRALVMVKYCVNLNCLKIPYATCSLQQHYCLFIL